MRRLLLVLFLVALVGAVGYTADKSYQFTGTVKTVDKGTFTVEKSAKEVWTFSTDSSTKGTPKVGDKVTVYYKMVATEIEAKPAAAKTQPAKPKK
jgi:hypothetical protein